MSVGKTVSEGYWSYPQVCPFKICPPYETQSNERKVLIDYINMLMLYTDQFDWKF